jgi:hypothetical protein
MEAVGLVASIVTLIGTVTLTSATLRKLWALRGSPLYMVTALNEVSDFKITLNLVLSAIDTAQCLDDIRSDLESLLNRARDRLARFDQYLKREVLRDGDGASKDVQLRLRRRTRLKEILGETQQEIFSLQKDLSSIKANLALVLGAANL